MRSIVDLWNELLQIEKSGIPAALVTVIQTKGSTPREVGAKMIVRLDGKTMGTIGGSAVEVLVITDAQEAIRQGKARRVQYNLNDVEKASTGMLCGGLMEFFIEPLQQCPHLYIFGGGHVGLSIARIAVELGYPHEIFDDRPEFAAFERFPQAQALHPGPYAKNLNKFPFIQPAYLIIVTHGHVTDLEVLRAVLDAQCEYLGMICSRKKKKEIFTILKEEGHSEKELERIHAPIGLDIGSKTPAEIAISILAEVIQRYQQKK